MSADSFAADGKSRSVCAPLCSSTTVRNHSRLFPSTASLSEQLMRAIPRWHVTRFSSPGMLRRMSILPGVLLTAAAFTSILTAQSGSPYSVANPWWQAGQGTVVPNTGDWQNDTGQLRVQNQGGDVQTAGHPFFTALGSNGRACVTCHQPSNGMTVGTALLQQRYTETQGNDPVFAAIDGSNCPNLPQSQMSSHSLLLNRGLFRIGLPWPPVGADGNPITPEFQIQVVADPTGCNTSPKYGLNSQQPTISVYRRPRVVANVQYLSGPDGLYLLADARATSLQAQAMNAAAVHEEAATPLTADQLRQIVNFELQVFAAQNWDIRGGILGEPGGPPMLGTNNLALGVPGAVDVPVTSDAFDSWRNQTGLPYKEQVFRQSAVRGADIFLSRQFQISPGVMGTCATCHQPGTARWMDIGTTNLPTARASPELPLFHITCDSSAAPHPTLGSDFYTQDPGRALITGNCADVGSILMQQFRGLAGRAPYFSNGSAATLNDLVNFYDARFAIGFTDEEKQDLVNLLSIL